MQIVVTRITGESPWFFLILTSNIRIVIHVSQSKVRIGHMSENWLKLQLGHLAQVRKVTSETFTVYRTQIIF